MINLSKFYKREYTAWLKIKNGCTKKDSKKYYLFGAKGFTICKKWIEFKNFIDDMGRLTHDFDGLVIAEGFQEFNKLTTKWAKIQRGAKIKDKADLPKNNKRRLIKPVVLTFSLDQAQHRFIKSQAIQKSNILGESVSINDLIREALKIQYPVASQRDMFGSEI